MTPDERVRRDIAEIATRQRSVRRAELEQIIGQLQKLGYPVSERPFPHGKLYRIGNTFPLTICDHHPGSSQLRPRYVREFLDRMTRLGLYEE